MLDGKKDYHIKKEGVEIFKLSADEICKKAFLCDLRICGVYFLVLEGRIVYVGQSTSVFSRIAQHYENKKFDSIAFIEVGEKDLNMVEAFYILKFRPILNGSFGISRWEEIKNYLSSTYGAENMQYILHTIQEPFCSSLFNIEQECRTQPEILSLSLDYTAQLLGVSTRALKRLGDDGPPFYELEGERLYPRAELTEWFRTKTASERDWTSSKKYVELKVESVA